MGRMLFLRDIDVDLEIRCRACGHDGVLDLSRMRRRFGPDYPVLSIAPHFRCSRCDSRDTECAPAPAPREPAPATPVFEPFQRVEPSPPFPTFESTLSSAPFAFAEPEPILPASPVVEIDGVPLGRIAVAGDDEPQPPADDPFDDEFAELGFGGPLAEPASLIDDAFPDQVEDASPVSLVEDEPIVPDDRNELQALRRAIATAIGDTFDDEEPLLLDASAEVRDPEPEPPPPPRPEFAIRDPEPRRDPPPAPPPPEPPVIETPALETPVIDIAPAGADPRSESIQGAMAALRDLVERAVDAPLPAPPAAGSETSPAPKSREAFETSLARLRNLLDLDETAGREGAEAGSRRTGPKGARLFRKGR